MYVYYTSERQAQEITTMLLSDDCPAEAKLVHRVFNYCELRLRDAAAAALVTRSLGAISDAFWIPRLKKNYGICAVCRVDQIGGHHLHGRMQYERAFGAASAN